MTAARGRASATDCERPAKIGQCQPGKLKPQRSRIQNYYLWHRERPGHRGPEPVTFREAAPDAHKRSPSFSAPLWSLVLRRRKGRDRSRTPVHKRTWTPAPAMQAPPAPSAGLCARGKEGWPGTTLHRLGQAAAPEKESPAALCYPACHGALRLSAARTAAQRMAGQQSDYRHRGGRSQESRASQSPAPATRAASVTLPN